jgi:large subunit ribosomal protein L4
LENVNLWLAARNVKRAKVVSSYGLNIYDLLYHEKLVLSRGAAEELTELLDPQPKKANGSEAEESQEEEAA